MQQIGGLLAFLGAFGAVLSFLDRVPSMLFWIYNWGDTMAWVIMIGLIVVGGALWFMGQRNEE